MHTAVSNDAGQRHSSALKVLQLTEACPHDGCNPDFCPLHDVRTLSPEARKEWVELLSPEDLEYLILHHEVCFQARTEGDLARISRLNLDEVARQIRSGIAKEGLYILTENDLGGILGANAHKTGLERRMHIDNFCAQYGFIALHEDDLTTVTTKSMSVPPRIPLV